jgi:hypothetical protein
VLALLGAGVVGGAAVEALHHGSPATAAVLAPVAPAVARGPAASSSKPGLGRRTAAMVGGGLTVAALAAVLWMRAGDEASSRPRAAAPVPPPTARPNDSARGSAPSVEPAPPGTAGTSGPSSSATPVAAKPDAATATRPERPAADAVARARTALDRVKAAIADPDAVAATGNGDAILGDLRRILATLPNRADSVEAVYYMIETNLILDRPAAACRLLTSVRASSRGTEFEAGIDRYLADSELGCATRR